MTVYGPERRCGAFTRTLELPVEVDPASVKATSKDGVLKRNLPKAGKISA
ncbi:MAG: Hsp20/alpha crystallin family protein [Desulfatiglandales bacterium]